MKMGLRQAVCKCILWNFLMIFAVAAIAVYHFVYLPDVNSFIRHVPPSYKSNFSKFPPKTQIKRQFRVMETCIKYSSSAMTVSDEFLIDESRQVAVCLIPKVGCTNWKRALILTGGKISEKDLNKILDPRSVERNPSSFLHSSRPLFWKFGIYHSDEYTETNLRRILPNFFKSMFVRCPYQRLLSAYRDKFEKEDYSDKLYYQKTYGKDIVNRYRTNATQNSLQTGSDVTFREFLQFIADSVAEGKTLDRHWKPFHKLCDPCIHNFDFIGKMETLDEDSQYVLSHLGGNIKFPSFMSGPSSYRHAKSNSESLLEYYASIPKPLLQKIIDIYKKDFELFGYKSNLSECSLSVT